MPHGHKMLTGAPASFLVCILPSILQVRVSDGARLRTLPCGVTSNVVAWAPHAHLLAFCCEDKEPSPGQYSVSQEACPVRLLALPPPAPGLATAGPAGGSGSGYG